MADFIISQGMCSLLSGFLEEKGFGIIGKHSTNMRICRIYILHLHFLILIIIINTTHNFNTIKNSHF